MYIDRRVISTSPNMFSVSLDKIVNDIMNKVSIPFVYDDISYSTQALGEINIELVPSGTFIKMDLGTISEATIEECNIPVDAYVKNIEFEVISNTADVLVSVILLEDGVEFTRVDIENTGSYSLLVLPKNKISGDVCLSIEYGAGTGIVEIDVITTTFSINPIETPK